MQYSLEQIQIWKKLIRLCPLHVHVTSFKKVSEDFCPFCQLFGL